MSLFFILKESPLQVLAVRQSSVMWLIPSCKGGWKFEYLAFKLLYYRKAGEKEIKMNECSELIVLVKLTLHRKQMTVISLCSGSQETSWKSCCFIELCYCSYSYGIL